MKTTFLEFTFEGYRFTIHDRPNEGPLTWQIDSFPGLMNFETEELRKYIKALQQLQLELDTRNGK